MNFTSNRRFASLRCCKLGSERRGHAIDGCLLLMGTRDSEPDGFQTDIIPVFARKTVLNNGFG